MNEEKEVMETIENEDPRPVESEDNIYEEVEGGSGKVIGLAIAGVATVAAVGVGLYKKLKAKNSDKPKRKRHNLHGLKCQTKRLMKNQSWQMSKLKKLMTQKQMKKSNANRGRYLNKVFPFSFWEDAYE